MENLAQPKRARRLVAGPLDIVLALALVAVVVLAVVRGRGPLAQAPDGAGRAPVPEQGQTVKLMLEMPDLQPELARQIRLGDVLTIGGRQLAEIEQLETYPIEVLAFEDGTGRAISGRTSGRLRVVAHASVPQWLDDLAKFKLGSVADFQTDRYSVPVRMIGIEETAPPPPDPAGPGAPCVIAADYVPAFIAQAALPGAYGTDALGHLRVRIDEVIEDALSPALRMYAFNDYSAYSQRFVAGGLLLRPPESRTLLLRLTLWPDQSSTGLMLDGTVLLPGVRADFNFRRFTLHGQVVSLGPGQP